MGLPGPAYATRLAYNTTKNPVITESAETPPPASANGNETPATAYVAGFVATVGVALALLFLAVAWRRTGALRSKLLVVVSLVVAVASIALPPFVVAILAVVFAVAAMRPATSRRPDAVS